MSSEAELGHAIAEAARTIHHARGLPETLQAIADGARRSIPGVDHAGISTIGKPGTETTVAATGDLVRELDNLQYGLHEGPCVDAMENAPDVVAAPDIRNDPRWPRYLPGALQAGLKSQLAVGLRLDEGTVGGLNMYSTSREEIHPDADSLAKLFAAHAAIALGSAREHHGLNSALHSRKVIGQALGILMERYETTEERAFAFLLRASQHGNIKLRDVAQEIVDQRNARGSN